MINIELFLHNMRRALFASLALAACSSSASAQAVSYTIQPSKPQQTVLHFGASDAWSMQFIGNWPEAQQKQIADWLFSSEFDEAGKPKGIGLSIWRFNLGAGSAEQGDSAQINPLTRTECLLRPDGSWDWSRQMAQRRFLRLAKERGVPTLLAFCNSAPVQFTANGLATNTGRGGTINLRPDCYDDFAQYLAKAVRGIEEHDGVRIDLISPLNESDGHWNWVGPKQEGSPATNREVAHVACELGKALKSDRKLRNTRILINESSDYRCMLGTHVADWQRGNEIKAFFSPDSADTYVGNVPQLEHVIGGHSYWTNTPVEQMPEIRMKLRDAVRKAGVDFWQTEICIMGNDEEIGGGQHFDYSMRTALYVARVIHCDLVFANAASWSWWRAVGGDYRDGLIRVYSNDGWQSGSAVDSKLLWSLGNYSLFVRPGAVRYDIEPRSAAGEVIEGGDYEPYGVMVSAYQNKDGEWVAVAINYSEETRNVNINVAGKENLKWRVYRTSDISAESLAPVGDTDGGFALTPKSISTFVSVN